MPYEYWRLWRSHIYFRSIIPKRLQMQLTWRQLFIRFILTYKWLVLDPPTGHVLMKTWMWKGVVFDTYKEYHTERKPGECAFTQRTAVDIIITPCSLCFQPQWCRLHPGDWRQKILVHSSPGPPHCDMWSWGSVIKPCPSCSDTDCVATVTLYVAC